MEALLDYYEKNSFYVEMYKDKYEALNKLKKYLKEPKDIKIYISNFCVKGLEEKIYIFLKDRLIQVIFHTKSSKLTTSYYIYKLKDLTGFEFVSDSSFESDTRLVLFFKEEIIELNNYDEYKVVNDVEKVKKKKINADILEGIFEFLLNNEEI